MTKSRVVGIFACLAVAFGVALAGGDGGARAGGWPLFLPCAFIGIALHWLAFAPSWLRHTERWFDLVGAMSFIATMLAAVLAHPAPDGRALLLAAMIIIWAARLGSFLYGRVKKAGGDRRFDEIKHVFWRFAFAWTLGGTWVLLTSAAALAAMTSGTPRPLGWFALAGGLLWLAGFAIEVAADRQKTRFRADPANADRFITTGLWSRSRHPNYFGEILLWIGIAVIALPALSGWQHVTLASPLFVILLLVRISGVRMLEERGRRRWGDDPAWRRYIAATPMLIPRLGKAPE